MKAIYGNGCRGVKNVRKWIWCAKSCSRDKMSVLDEQRSGWLITVTHEENQRRMDAMIQENQQIKLKDIVLSWDISKEHRIS